jgi:hypothetical protein
VNKKENLQTGSSSSESLVSNTKENGISIQKEDFSLKGSFGDYFKLPIPMMGLLVFLILCAFGYKYWNQPHLVTLAEAFIVLFGVAVISGQQLMKKTSTLPVKVKLLSSENLGQNIPKQQATAGKTKRRTGIKRVLAKVVYMSRKQFKMHPRRRKVKTA